MSDRYAPFRRVASLCWIESEDDAESSPRSIEVIEDEDGAPVDTGLLYSSGTKLYRVRDRRPIGFDLTPQHRRIVDG